MPLSNETQPAERIPVFFFLGAPGSGKGTQSKLIQNHLRFLHVSSGDLLRRAIDEGDPAALAARELIDRGELVPDEMIITMLREHLRKCLESSHDVRGIIIDGFPRTVNQAENLESLLESLNLQFMGMILLQVPEQTLVDRLRSRAQEGENRSDDQEHVIRHRLQVWREKTHPLEEFFAQRNQLFTVDGLGDTEEVFQRLLPILQMSHESVRPVPGQ